MLQYANYVLRFFIVHEDFCIYFYLEHVRDRKIYRVVDIYILMTVLLDYMTS